jgi:hypothetical protein
VLRHPAEKVIRATRSNFTAAALTWKVAAALLQWTGVVPAAAELGVGYASHGMRVYLTNPRRAMRYVDGASPLMRQRAGHIVDSIDQLHASKQSLLRAARSANAAWGMKLIGQTQRMVDLVTWIGAEKKGMRLFGGDVAKARLYADDIVTRTQGTQEFIDKNALLRGTLHEGMRQTEVLRALMTLQGYMLSKGNLAYRMTARAAGEPLKLDAASVRRSFRWTAQMVALFTVDAVLSSLVRNQWPHDDDEDGLDLGDWLLFAGEETGLNILGAFPGGSSAVSGMRGFDQQGVVSAAWSQVGDLATQVQQGEWDRALL